MANESQEKKIIYDRKYGAGDGWRYDYERESKILKGRILPFAGWKEHDRIIEIGCGEGFHSQLLTNHGFRVMGIDISTNGIAIAKKKYPNVNFLNTDLSLYKPPHGFVPVDGIFARGMSWYHYDLFSHLEDTQRLFKDILKPGGTFVLQICTDGTGVNEPGKVHNNTVQNYTKFFNECGTVEHCKVANKMSVTVARNE